jgi:AraC-like DNA-binding protein
MRLAVDLGHQCVQRLSHAIPALGTLDRGALGPQPCCGAHIMGSMTPSSKLCELPVLLARVAAAFGDRARVRPTTHGFALVEHAWHLADLEREAFQVRIARLASEPAPWLPDYDGDRIAHERAYLDRSLATGVQAFVRVRSDTVRQLTRIRGRVWQRGGIQDQVGYVTLGELPERILAHDRAHAVELAALIATLAPGHALADEVQRWAAAITEPPASPCNSAASARPRTASALPLARIQQAVAACVVTGRVSTAAVGRALGLSARTLQRRLADHGMTVSCLVEESMRALAIARIRTGAEWRGAAFELGFGDPRAFARAFKRWTRVTPAAFQRAPAVSRRGCA